MWGCSPLYSMYIHIDLSTWIRAINSRCKKRGEKTNKHPKSKKETDPCRNSSLFLVSPINDLTTGKRTCFLWNQKANPEFTASQG